MTAFRSIRRSAADSEESAFAAIAVSGLLLSVLFAIARPAPAQTAAPVNQGASGPYRIAGAVVSSADGHPLEGASISIRLDGLDTVPARPLTRTTTSNEDGRFEFTGLPAGNFTLQGEARNFLLTRYDDHDGFTTGIITGSTVATDALILKLVPQASLSGAITNESGEPVQNASVHLFRQSHSLGDDRIVSAGTQSTDDLGRFDFSSLQPGDYLVAVTAQPWYAVHPQPSPSLQLAVNVLPQIPNAPPQQQQQMRVMLANLQRQAFFGVTGPLDPALDVAYPITYYPNSADPVEAQPIPLRPGDSRQISLQLAPVPAITVTVPRPPQPNPPPNPADGSPAPIQARLVSLPPQLRVSIFGNLESAGVLQMQSNGGDITYSGLAPGDYLLAGNVPFNQSLGATSIHLSSSDRTLTASIPDASTLAHVHIALVSASSSQSPANMPIGLIRAGTHDLVSGNAGPKGDTVLNVPPGDYSFTVQSANSSGRGARNWLLRGITADGKPLPANSIHLAAGDSPSITLNIVPGNHTLRGLVVHPGDSAAQPQPAPGVFLLLIPADQLNGEMRHFWRQQSDLDGSFSISGLASGSYTLFAIDDGWTLNWQLPGALDLYLPAAARITIPDSSSPIIFLPQAVPAQPK